MDDNVDAKQILTSSPSMYWNTSPGRLWMTWMKTVQNNLNSHGLSWTEAVNLEAVGDQRHYALCGTSRRC